jgi:SNF2 family DNA or RNA helicase
MGLFDFFRRSIPKNQVAHTALKTEVTAQGLLLNFNANGSTIDLDSLLEVDDSASTDEKLLRAYLSDLFIDGKCELSDAGVLLPWDAFYQLAGDPQHTALLALIEPPNISKAIPLLNNTGAVSDEIFHVEISGWILDGQRVDLQIINLPEVSVNGQKAIVTRDVNDLISTLNANFSSPTQSRSQKENEAAWGVVRAQAIKAGALFVSRYLDSTIVLTPQTLRIPAKKQNSSFGHVYTVEPTFDGAPDGWLTAFDGFQAVQDHYDITRDGGRIRIILSEPVRKVLEVVKREMPTRKISGAKAEMFAHNPRAYLGDFAEGVLDEAEKSDRSTDIDTVATSFHLVPEILNGSIVGSKFIINEFYSDGYTCSFKEVIESPEALAKLTSKIGDALGDQRLMVTFNEFDLTLDANAQVEFERMLGILRTWQNQGDAVIRLEDIYELSDYSNRIEGIGIAKPIFVPALQKEKKEGDEGNGWIPDDLTPVLKVMLPGSGDPVLVPLTKEWVEKYEAKVTDAEKSGSKTVDDPAIASALETAQARVLVEGFKSLLGGQESSGSTSKSGQELDDNPRGDEASKGKKKKETLLVKSNFSSISYAEARKALLTLPDGVEPRLPSTLRSNIELKAHQLYGIAWFQHLYAMAPGEVRGCLLADDMGLGKTLQLLNVLGKIYEDEPDSPPSLILVPKSLLQNWASEVEKFFTPSFPKHLVLYGNELVSKKQPRYRIDEELRTKGIADLLVPNWVGQNKLIITTYDVLTGFEFSFAKQEFSFVICDEAQRIKNPAANVSSAVRKLKAKFRVACTGTPVENSLADLWCLFDFFQPGLLGSLEEFFKTYRKPIECKSEEQVKALRQLQSLIRPQTLRRTKKDIAADLPNKFFAVSGQALGDRLLKPKLDDLDLLKVEITDHQRVLYKGGLLRLREARQEKDGKRRGRLSFDALHFMKAVCAEPYCLPGRKFLPDPAGIEVHLKNSPKLAWMLSELESIKAKREKAIVFTEIREVQTALHYFLRERFKLKPFIVNGDSENRQSFIDKFSSNDGFDVIILSPLAAGAGLNVVAANHVFHFTRAWNPAKEAQATDRAYRIGQEKDVIVYCPTIIDTADSLYSTFEQRLDQLLKEKAALASSAIDGDDLTQMLNGSAGDVGFTEFMAFGGPTTQTAPRILNIADIDQLDGNSFEIFSALLFSKMGFIAQVTEKHKGDGGIDLIALNNGSGLLVQCKSSQSTSIGWDAIKEVVGGAMRYQSKMPSVKFKKVAITNQLFNATANDQAAFNHVDLIDRPQIEKMLQEHRITDFELDELLIPSGPISGS